MRERIDRDRIETFADRQAWLENRRLGIGGSDVPQILGLSPWGSALEVYLEKVGLGQPIQETEVMRWGNLLEDVVAREWAQRTGREIYYPGAHAITWAPTGPDLPLFASLDRVILGEREGILQIKTTGPHGAEAWAEGIPGDVFAQVQHEIFCADVDWGAVACLIAGQEMRFADVERDETFIQETNLPACRDLWEAVLGRRDPPEPRGTDQEKRILSAPPAPDEKVVSLDASFVETDAEIAELKDIRKEADERIAALENRIRLAIKMEDATGALLPDGVLYTFKDQTRKAYEVAESTFRVLRRHKAKH